MFKNVRTQRYRWNYKQVSSEDIADLSNSQGYPVPIAELILKKGFESAEEIDSFFNGSLQDMSDPFEILDMDKAANRIASAVMNNEKIYVYGDYDVDGVTSTSVMSLFLAECGADVFSYIPNRLEEGYGLNNDAIKEIASSGAKLLITVDCGISAVDEVAYAASLGLDVVLTDHHQQGEVLPEAAYAIVNPMRIDDKSSNKGLAGVGVAFKVIVATRRVLNDAGYFDNKNVPNLKNLLDIVSLGTIADVMPLKGENRIIVKYGLELMNSDSPRVGIDELKKLAKIQSTSIKASNISYQIAPRINAMGRMGSSNGSLRLLTTFDRDEAKELANSLEQENSARQLIEKEILSEAIDIIMANGYDKDNAIVVVGEGWHPGVIGIVASRIMEKFYKPTVILSNDDAGLYKGSGRSIPCFHLYDALVSLSDLMISFGGHKYAAGVKIAKENINIFREKLNEMSKNIISSEEDIPEINIDARLSVSDIDDNIMSWLNKFEPYGPGNTEPIFCIQNVTKYKNPDYCGKDQKHLKCYFSKDGINLDTIGFNMKDYAPILLANDKFDILFTLSYNEWNNQKNIQLSLKDLKKAE